MTVLALAVAFGLGWLVAGIAAAWLYCWAIPVERYDSDDEESSW